MVAAYLIQAINLGTSFTTMHPVSIEQKSIQKLQKRHVLDGGMNASAISEFFNF